MPEKHGKFPESRREEARLPRSIRHLPIRPEAVEEIRRHSGVFKINREGSRAWVAKDTSAFYHDRIFFGSKALRRLNVELPGQKTDGQRLAYVARAYASLYSHLRDLGAFHPDARFAVVKARNGKAVSILGLMPHMLRPLTEWDEPVAVFERKQEIERIVRKELAKIIGKPRRGSLPNDRYFAEQNFYHTGDGRVFLVDLHLPGLTRGIHNGIVAWYASQKR